MKYRAKKNQMTGLASQRGFDAVLQAVKGTTVCVRRWAGSALSNARGSVRLV